VPVRYQKLLRVRVLYQRDMEQGQGGASLPNTLGRKCPNAPNDTWHVLFPSKGQQDPHYAYAMPGPTIAIAVNVE
jgi:hypothetical protein